MKFHKKRHKKVNRYRKINLFEYAIIFNDSNSLIDYICTNNHQNALNSSLYTVDGHYQLLITSTAQPHFSSNTLQKDKLHIQEIKNTSQLICKTNAIYKMKKAFLRLK